MKEEYKKATQAINYLASKFQNETINDLIAIKLIWMADRYHLRRYGRPVVWNQYFAMKKGPVNSLVKDIAEKTSFISDDAREYTNQYISRSQYDIKSLQKPDIKVFSQTDIEALDFAYSQLGNMQKFDVVKYTHEFPEWKKQESKLSGTNEYAEIDFDDFFLNPTSKINNPFNESADQILESREAFEEQKRLIGFWK